MNFSFFRRKNLKFDLCLKTNLMGVVDGLFLCCRYVANVKHHWSFLMLMNRAQSMNECSQLVSPISGTFNILHLGHGKAHIGEQPKLDKYFSNRVCQNVKDKCSSYLEKNLLLGNLYPQESIHFIDFCCC